MSVTVPITITDEAKDYVAELGMQEPFQRMLDHAVETISALRELRVSVQPAYDLGAPCVLLDAVTPPPRSGYYDTTEDEWGRWRVTTFPPEVFQHFVLLVVYEPADAR